MAAISHFQTQKLSRIGPAELGPLAWVGPLGPAVPTSNGHNFLPIYRILEFHIPLESS